MNTFAIELPSELYELGATRRYTGTLANETSYEVGGQLFDTPAGADYAITLSNTGEALLVQGTAKAHAVTGCARCLEPAEVDVEGEVEGYFFFEHHDEVEGMEADEYDFVENGVVDLSGPVLAALVYATPFVVYCKDDCQGLCPRCGKNLNDGPCGCGDDQVDPTNPFAVLATLKFDTDSGSQEGQVLPLSGGAVAPGGATERVNSAGTDSQD